MAITAASTAHALRGTPTFQPAASGDGPMRSAKRSVWLPAPHEHNVRSYDLLLVCVDNPVQLPVGEAAPGDPAYNGGRWFAHTVVWTNEARQV